MRRRDLRAVSTIEADRNPDPWSRRLFAGELELDPTLRHWVVASVGPRVIGFGGVMYGADEAHMLNLAVTGDWAGRGVGQALCLELLAEAQRRETVGFTLEVRVSNDAAIGLYHKLGLSSSGIRPGYYPDGEDAVIMWIHDLSQPEVGARLDELTAAPAASGRDSAEGGPIDRERADRATAERPPMTQPRRPPADDGARSRTTHTDQPPLQPAPLQPAPPQPAPPRKGPQ